MAEYTNNVNIQTINTTLVIGASINPGRYSYKAIKALRHHKINVVAVGLREGIIEDVIITHGLPDEKNIDTVTMYIGAENQRPYFDFLISLKPRRVIFNPGAENKELSDLLSGNGIEVIEDCTLVMLATGQY
jgi:uncharacterized protein